MTPDQPAGRPADLVAVEPDLAEHIIDLLASAGITAVDRPVSGGLVMVVVRASDLERARSTVELVLPGLLAEESGQLLDYPEVPRTGRTPLSGRLIRRNDWPEERGAPRPPGHGLIDGRAAFDRVDGGGGGGLLPDPDAEDDFVPPEPPPIPRGDVVSRFAWLGAVGGPILIVVSGLLGLPSPISALGLAGFVVGFGVLVARMPDRPRQDDGWDDGAVL